MFFFYIEKLYNGSQRVAIPKGKLLRFRHSPFPRNAGLRSMVLLSESQRKFLPGWTKATPTELNHSKKIESGLDKKGAFI